jgi:hypothetical protein
VVNGRQVHIQSSMDTGTCTCTGTGREEDQNEKDTPFVLDHVY